MSKHCRVNPNTWNRIFQSPEIHLTAKNNTSVVQAIPVPRGASRDTNHMNYCILGKIEKTDIYEYIVCRHPKSTHKYSIYKYRQNKGGFRNTQHLCLNCLIIFSSTCFPHPNWFLLGIDGGDTWLSNTKPVSLKGALWWELIYVRFWFQDKVEIKLLGVRDQNCIN